MARIRTIKPESPPSESTGRVLRDARLLFVMLFTIVDDEGRARAATRMLASLLFPYDDDANAQLAEWLSELERENCVELYEVDGNASSDRELVGASADRQAVALAPSRAARETGRAFREPARGFGPGREWSRREWIRFVRCPIGPMRSGYSNLLEGLSHRCADVEKERAGAVGEAFTSRARGGAPRDSGFKDYCRKNPTYRPVHAERFLSQKRFEGFAQAGALSATEIEVNRDRADRLMRRGKYAVSYQ
jgi:hypothetical protein